MLSTASSCSAFPKAAGGHLVVEVLLEIRGVAREQHRASLRQLDPHGHVAGGVAGGHEGAHAPCHLVLSGLDHEGIDAPESSAGRREDRGVDPLRSAPIIPVEVDLRPAALAAEFLETARVIEVKVADEDHIDVLRKKSEAAEETGSPLVFIHLRGAEIEDLRS